MCSESKVCLAQQIIPPTLLPPFGPKQMPDSLFYANQVMEAEIDVNFKFYS